MSTQKRFSFIKFSDMPTEVMTTMDGLKIGQEVRRKKQNAASRLAIVVTSSGSEKPRQETAAKTATKL